MQTFIEWLSWINLLETYYGLDNQQYNALFDDELAKVIQHVSDPVHREALQRMRNFNWVGYIAASVRNAGFQDQRERDEKTHEVVVKLLLGKLFKGFNEKISGPFDLRFRRSVGNAIRNIVELERNRRRYIPTTPIVQGFEPGSVAAADLPARPSFGQDEQVIENFRRLLQDRLGDLAVAIFDMRMAGGETKSLVGSPTLGSPSPYVIKRTVQQIKALGRQFAVSLGDFTLLRRIDKAMQDEAGTVAKRRAALQRVGA